jgi:hypothetical protein
MPANVNGAEDAQSPSAKMVFTEVFCNALHKAFTCLCFAKRVCKPCISMVKSVQKYKESYKNRRSAGNISTQKYLVMKFIFIFVGDKTTEIFT